MVLLDNREVKQGWEPLKQTVTAMFEKFNADVVSARRWDERPLAYPIRGQRRGTYMLVYYKGDPQQNTGIRRELELAEPVLRYMTTVCEEIPAEAHEPEAEFAELRERRVGEVVLLQPDQVRVRLSERTDRRLARKRPAAKASGRSGRRLPRLDRAA